MSGRISKQDTNNPHVSPKYIISQGVVKIKEIYFMNTAFNDKQSSSSNDLMILFSHDF